MTVLNGLSNLFLGGLDISGDAGAISAIRGGPALLDVSSIDVRGTKRIAGRIDGEIGYNVFFNPLGAHVPLSAYPTTDQLLMVPIPGATAGDICAMLVAKQIGYNPAIGQDLSASFSVQALASAGFPLEWGQIITAGKRTDNSASAAGVGIDLGVPAGVAATNITSSSVANPTHIVSAAHGLQTGDSVLIAGHTGSTPAVDGEYTVTFVDANEFTIPLNVSVGGGATGTVQRTSHRGWAAQNQVFAVTGTSGTTTLQDSHEAIAGSFANITGGAFAAVSQATGHSAERLESAAGIIKRYVRVKSTGTFTVFTFATGIYVKEG